MNGSIEAWQVEWQRCCSFQTLMRSPLVVVLTVFGENSSQVRLIQDNEPVQALLAQGPHLALRIGIGIGSSKRRPDDFHPFGPEHGIKSSGEFRVAIMDQEPNRQVVLFQRPGQLPRLLGRPRRIWMSRAPSHKYTSGSQVNEEENVRGLKTKGLHRQEVAGEYLVLVMLQERPPRASPS